MTGKEKKKDKNRGYYGRALDEVEKLALEEACGVEGLDEEIAVLRFKMRQLVENEPEKFELCLKAANTLARLIGIRYNISKEQKKSLKEAITKVITEIAVPLGIKILFK
ncbi:MAG: hypothetical protein A2Z02_03790 [Chloroflexi bacterium RBG_16_48_7]|nr:MAG: hypothetical protein A2Z02_03790 [Chloroflexi bacterium RBG_16_48_7]